MSIKILKLVNGDDVISNINESKEFVLKNPAKIMIFPTEGGEMGMGMVPWCPYTDQKDFTIEKSHIMTMFDAPEGIRNQYSQEFGSGLVTPPTDLIL